MSSPDTMVRMTPKVGRKVQQVKNNGKWGSEGFPPWQPAVSDTALSDAALLHTKLLAFILAALPVLLQLLPAKHTALIISALFAPDTTPREGADEPIETVLKGQSHFSSEMWADLLGMEEDFAGLLLKAITNARSEGLVYSANRGYPLRRSLFEGLDDPSGRGGAIVYCIAVFGKANASLPAQYDPNWDAGENWGNFVAFVQKQYPQATEEEVRDLCCSLYVGVSLNGNARFDDPQGHKESSEASARQDDPPYLYSTVGYDSTAEHKQVVLCRFEGLEEEVKKFCKKFKAKYGYPCSLLDIAHVSEYCCFFVTACHRMNPIAAELFTRTYPGSFANFRPLSLNTTGGLEQGTNPRVGVIGRSVGEQPKSLFAALVLQMCKTDLGLLTGTFQHNVALDGSLFFLRGALTRIVPNVDGCESVRLAITFPQKGKKFVPLFDDGGRPVAAHVAGELPLVGLNYQPIVASTNEHADRWGALQKPAHSGSRMARYGYMNDAGQEVLRYLRHLSARCEALKGVKNYACFCMQVLHGDRENYEELAQIIVSLVDDDKASLDVVGSLIKYAVL